jgi:glycosyltransferase involved in cell wall biosynthesis
VVWWAHDYWLLCAKRSFIDPYNASKEELCDKAAKKDCSRCMGLKTRMKYVLWKRIMNYTVDHAIAPAKILQEIHEYNNILQGKWSVIVPWIDSEYLNNSSLEKKKKKKDEEKNPIILFVGSLIEFKGAWVAAKAMKKICAAYPDAKLLFIGGEQEKEGKYRRQIDEICQQDGTSNAVVFLGKKTKEEIHELQRTAVVYICPTVCMESFGLNWAEAMAAGIPVVASAIGSIPEYVKDCERGLLFPARDHEALAQCVIKLFRDSRLAKHLAENGQQYVQKQFRVERATDEILGIYNRLLDKTSL